MPKSNPKVSVIIPTYNYGYFITETISSVLNQSFSDLEIIVIDDGSNDNTGEIVTALDGPIHYYYQENAGVSRARNTGIEHACGIYVAILDADDCWLLEKLSKQVALLDAQPDTGLVFTDGYRCDGNLQIFGTIFNGSRPGARISVSEALLWDNFIPASSVMLRKACFEKVGLFDETMKGSEDWLMWFNISRFYQIEFIDEPLIKYREHNSSLSVSNSYQPNEIELVALQKMLAQRDLPSTIQRKKNKLLAYRHRRIGSVYLHRKEMCEARTHFWQSVKLNPFQLAPYRMLLKTFNHQSK